MVGTPSFGAYFALTTTTTAQNKTDIIANLNAFKALFQAEGPSVASTSAGQQPVYPDFDEATPRISQQIINEINALITIITNSP